MRTVIWLGHRPSTPPQPPSVIVAISTFSTTARLQLPMRSPRIGEIEQSALVNAFNDREGLERFFGRKVIPG